MLRSSANFFARGEAFSPPFVGAETLVVSTVFLSTVSGTDGVTGFGASFLTSFFSSFGTLSSFSVFFLCSLRILCTSSSFSPSMAHILSTGALPPSSTPICKSTPS